MSGRRSRQLIRRRLPIAGSVALALTLASAAGTPVARADTADSGRAVIVEATSVTGAARAVRAVGGTVDLDLPLVSGVAAHVDADARAKLGATPGIRVMNDASAHTTGATFGADAASPQVRALDPGANWSLDAGAGVAVALVDTGVATTPDLAGRLVRGPDFSGEGDGIDRFGHGTFMAGLIAGDGSGSAQGPTRYTGTAPGATIVSVKVAGADGRTSLSRIIAGLGWVVEHADTYGIGVVSLSFSLDAPMPYFANPLDGAIELVWASDITVVAAAGNEGSAGVTSPGDDPYVITVGATNDDLVAPWSGTENFRRYAKPEVAAPGASVVSLRAPGSTIDRANPGARVGDAYFRGSGTSMSTALVAGAAAILLAHHGLATPDDVKGALVDSSRPVTGGRVVDIAAADMAAPRAGWWQRFPLAFDGFEMPDGDGMPWTATRWRGDTWAATRWAATRWAATRWAATRWAATRWAATRWAATRWASTRWASTRWADLDWAAASWPSQSWG